MNEKWCEGTAYLKEENRIFEGGKPLSDAYTDTKTSVMIVPPPDVIEAKITENFSLFAETCDDSDDSDS